MITEFEEAPSTSGTWLHPKTYYKARTSKENSNPVKMFTGI